MNQEVVKNFLNLPGLVGLVLADERSRPYFYSLDQMLNGQQRELVTKGIWQIIASLPGGIESFEFQFLNYQVYIYRLNQELILMTLMEETQANTLYTRAVDWLRQELLDSSSSAIADFRLAASKVPSLSPARFQPVSTTTLRSNQNAAAGRNADPSAGDSSQAQVANGNSAGRRGQPTSSAPPSPKANPASSTNTRAENSAGSRSPSPSPAPPDQRTARSQPAKLGPEDVISPSPPAEPLDYDQLFTNKKSTNQPSTQQSAQQSVAGRASTPQSSQQSSQSASARPNPSPESKASPKASPKTSPKASKPSPEVSQSPSSAPAARTIKAYVAALNRLSEFTKQYLGTAVVCNYLKSTRPKQEWLEEFQIDRSASIQIPPGDPARVLNSDQQAEIQAWVNLFVKRCSSVIRDFPALIRDQGLDETDKIILLSEED